MNYLITVALVLLVYWKLKNQYYQKIASAYSYKLEDLRDKLMDYALDNKVDVQDWRFKFLNVSLSKNIEELHSLNIYLSLFIHLRNKDNQAFQKMHETVAEGISSHPQFNEIYQEYTRVLMSFMLSKLFWFKTVIKIHSFSSKTRKQFRTTLNSILISQDEAMFANMC